MIIDKIKDNIVFSKIDPKINFFENELVEFQDENKTKGILLSTNGVEAFFAVLSEEHRLTIGTKISRKEKFFSIDMLQDPFGKVLDFEGKEIKIFSQQKAKKEASKFSLKKLHKELEIEPEILSLSSRALVNKPLKTGTTLIDATLAIGKGQRELIIGDRQTGKTSIAIDAIINQKGQDVICIYNVIGGKLQDIISTYEKLRHANALDYTFIVSASASDLSIKQWLSPYVATTMAEAFRNEGRDVLIVYDDLSAHAKAYRSISLLTGANPGREAYPGDIFYAHSRLLERAGQFNEKAGSGSITALPIIQTEKSNISAYIPTNVISITDGQIFTSTELFNRNIKPAVDINISVSRVGSTAQTTYLKSVVGQLKILVAQYSKIVETFTSESALSQEKKKIYRQGKIVSEIFMQKNNKPLAYEFEWLLLLLMNAGAFDVFDSKDIYKVKKYLQKFVSNFDLPKRFLKFIEENEKNYNKEIHVFFALQIFMPFVKWVGLMLYSENTFRKTDVLNAFTKYPNLSFEVSHEDDEYSIYSADNELDQEFISADLAQELTIEFENKERE